MNKTFIIDDDYNGARLDRWFKKKVCNVPQSLIEKSIRKGNIKVNSKKEKSSYRIKKNDHITLKNLTSSKAFFIISAAGFISEQ